MRSNELAGSPLDGQAAGLIAAALEAVVAPMDSIPACTFVSPDAEGPPIDRQVAGFDRSSATFALNRSSPASPPGISAQSRGRSTVA
jgi:hypothetical protein